MQFSENDLHDAMKISLEVLIDISKRCPEVEQRASAAVSLASLILEIYDRQHREDFLDDILDGEDYEDGTTQ